MYNTKRIGYKRSACLWRINYWIILQESQWATNFRESKYAFRWFLCLYIYMYVYIYILVSDISLVSPGMTIAGMAIIVRQTVKIRRNKDVTQRLCMYTWAERSVMRCSQACDAVYLRTAHPRSIPRHCPSTCSCRTEKRSITIRC